MMKRDPDISHVNANGASSGKFQDRRGQLALPRPRTLSSRLETSPAPAWPFYPHPAHRQEPHSSR